MRDKLSMMFLLNFIITIFSLVNRNYILSRWILVQLRHTASEESSKKCIFFVTPLDDSKTARSKMSAKAVRIKQRVSSFADTIANKHQGHFAGLGEVMTEGVIRAYDTIYSLRGGIQWEVWIRRRISWVIIALVR